MIELKNVSKFYKDNNIVTVGLKNVSLKLNKGEIVAITGDSGSGKSTLLNVISLIDSYDDGEILFYGNETFYFNQNDSDAFRKDNVSFIFQKYNIIDSYTVLQNVMLPLIINGVDEKVAQEKALEIIKRVGLEERANNKGSKLSGGEKQRCVIARALAKDTPILACDEPTGNLDSKTSKEIIDLIKEVSKDKLVLIVTHDFESVKDIYTRKIKMSDGEIVEDKIIKQGIIEENKDLVLMNSNPKKKTLFKLAYLNIVSTPKKTIFTSMVFAFVSCVLLLLSLLMVQISYEENYTYNESYGLILEDRLIIYDINQETLDLGKLEPLLEGYEYYINAFYEELEVRIDAKDSTAYTCLTYRKFDYKLLTGQELVGDNDYILVVPEYMSWSAGNYDLGDFTITVEVGTMGHVTKMGNLVGVGVSEYVDKIYLVGNKYNQNYTSIYINNNVNFGYVDASGYRGYLDIAYDSKLQKSFIAIPNNMKNKCELDFKLNNFYGVKYNVDIVYTDAVDVPTFYINQDYLEGRIKPEIEVKEVVVYTDNINKLSKQIKGLGYKVSIPSKIENTEGANLFVLYVLIGVILVALFIMFFITYAVIQRIYLTKKKDYSIFRTLGLVSIDLKKILYIEILLTILVSMIIGIGIAFGLIFITKIDLYKYMSIPLGIIYVLAIIIFGLAIALRLNNRIFKNTVFQAIKEGSEQE